MSLISYLDIDEQRFNIAPDRKVFGNLFAIDSCHLLLGRNGSGKTTLLVRIASLIAQRYARDIYVEDDQGGSRPISNAEHAEQGVLFFTALPYRRKLVSAKRVVDASASGRGSSLGNDLTAFAQVSSELGVETQLRGHVGFTSAVWSEILLPAALAATPKDANQAFSPGLNEALTVLRHNDLSSTPGDEDRLDANNRDPHIRGARTFAINELKHMMQDRLENEYVIALSSLEELASTTRDKARLGAMFLNQLGFRLRSNQNTAWHRYSEIVDATRKYLDQQNSVEQERDRISFQLTSADLAREIQASVSAIKVEWSALSSGMRAMVDQFSRIRTGLQRLADQGCTQVLVLIDEGDVYLHLEWQRQYVDLIDRYLGGLKREMNLQTLQVVLSTHSPVIATDFPRSMITNLDGTPLAKTFAAPLDEIALSSFHSNTIGVFSARKIDELHVRLKLKDASAADRALMDEIGDILIKNALERVAPK